MNRVLRQVAFLMIFVFMANVQAWALTINDEVNHDGSANSQLAAQPSDNVQQESHDCDQTGKHCCHAASHLLGQVSDRFALNNLTENINLYLTGDVSASSVDSEDFYRPPRTPSLT
jgi:hypothetical protein